MKTETIICNTLGEKIEKERELKTVGWPYTIESNDELNAWVITYQNPYK